MVRWTTPDSPGVAYCKTGYIGSGVYLGSDIGSPDNPVDWVEIGDQVYIGAGCNIWAKSVSIRDYTKIHRNCLIYGRNPIAIGYNCWFGEGTIIDCEGNTRIGDNVGVGAHSQLWSHIRHGDVMLGCKYLNFGQLNILNDAWLVGHCVVSPVNIGPCSVVLAGSVVTKDVGANRIYGGSPAKDLTDKLGEPFQFTTVTSRYDYMRKRLAEFLEKYAVQLENEYGGITIVTDWAPPEPHVTQFNVTTRQYRKLGTRVEVAFMKFLLPEAKFIPVIG